MWAPSFLNSERSSLINKSFTTDEFIIFNYILSRLILPGSIFSLVEITAGAVRMPRERSLRRPKNTAALLVLGPAVHRLKPL